MFEFFIALAFIGFFVGQLMTIAPGPKSDLCIGSDGKPDSVEPCYTREEWLIRSRLLKKAA